MFYHHQVVKVVLDSDLSKIISHQINVIGFFCPVPLSETKKALKNLKRGDVLEVIADDPEAVHDISMLIERMPHRMSIIDEQTGEFRFIIEVKE
tara:strand:+ start:1250 stop:1531 length:282 start_codon:yes stop_codon:yes gene_type:complete